MFNLIDDFCKNTGKEVVADANVLILYLVGSTNINYIKKVKATKIFSEDDYYNLKNIIERFETVLTTPNILTEVSNLAGQKKKYEKELYFKEELFENFGDWICKNSTVEKFIISEEITKDHVFNRLGLTDTAIIKLLEKQSGVITTDLKLRLELENRGLKVLNFTYLMKKK